jgi:hypothetical protein
MIFIKVKMFQMGGKFSLPRGSGQTTNRQTQLMQRMRGTAGKADIPWPIEPG